MLLKFDFLSINQASAQMKIQEAWKASRDPNFPINFGSRGVEGERETEREVRTTTRRRMKEGGKNKIAEESFVRDTGNSRSHNHRNGKDKNKKIL